MSYFSSNHFAGNFWASDYWSGDGVVIDTERFDLETVTAIPQPLVGVPALVVALPGVMSSTLALAAVSILWRKLWGATQQYLPLIGEPTDATLPGAGAVPMPAPAVDADYVPFPGSRIQILTIDGAGSVVIILPGASGDRLTLE